MGVSIESSWTKLPGRVFLDSMPATAPGVARPYGRDYDGDERRAPMSPRSFTLDEANGRLPWLRTRFSQVREVRRQLEAAHQEQRDLARGGRGNGASDASRHLQEHQARIRDLERQAEALLNAVLEQGIIVRDPERGLVDFPALREGREVHLCWQMGEDEVRHWHEVDAGFSGRQPL